MIKLSHRLIYSSLVNCILWVISVEYDEDFQTLIIIYLRRVTHVSKLHSDF